jgi:hypothetical protein
MTDEIKDIEFNSNELNTLNIDDNELKIDQNELLTNIEEDLNDKKI